MFPGANEAFPFSPGLILNPFAGELFSLWSPLSPNECSARLQARVLRWQDAILPPASVVGHSEVVVGQVTPERFKLNRCQTWRGSYWIGNAFNTVAEGSFKPKGAGTAIRVHLRVNRLGAAFVLGSIAALLLIIFSWTNLSLTSRIIMASFCLIGSSVLFTPVYLLCRLVAQQDAAILLHALSTSIQAQPEES